MSARRGWAALCVACLFAGCTPLRSGWDSESLIRSEPRIAEISHQRIGDMTPYPALLDGRILLVACRYGDEAESVLVSQSAASPQAEWTRRAVEAVNEAVAGVALGIEGPQDRRQGEVPQIEIEWVGDPDAPDPRGMGDTLTECDVSAQGDSSRSVRGRMTRSEIRLRPVVRDPQGRLRATTEVEWVGALIHELGHALGFSGHAALGDSLVVLDETRLRSQARRVLQGEPLAAPNLTALYSVEPGRILGEVELAAEAREWIAIVESIVADRNGRLGSASGPYASSGDDAARLVWRWAGGLQVELRLPFWREEIRKGQAITVRPDAQTRWLRTKTED